MSALATTGRSLPATPPAAMERVRALEAQVQALPQVQIPTDHVIHAGLYARTIRIPASVILTGAEISCATLLIVSGHVAVTVGDDTQELIGYHVLPAAAGRKQAFLALADTDLTMLFATDARDIATAEGQFTTEPERLMSRAPDAINIVTITGD
ncbi:MAG TPA: hypothetical protein PKV98_18980 [Burkholderiaceae bacterium]|nr:hypothetical protein [Burkholderiaceae bacterium]